MNEPINILLVDDRQENLLSLAAILDSPDYALVKAQSGSEALRALLDKDRDFALILMDVRMPVLDGFETAHLIKQREKCRHIPIIFVTANSEEERLVHRGYDAGAVDYILKPVNPGILRSKVYVFAELHRKTKQLLKQAELIREHEADQRYRDLVEGIHNGVVWTMGADTLRPNYFSDSVLRILGYPAELLIREPHLIRKVIHPDDFERVLASLSQSEAKIEHRVIAADGRTVWLETAVKRREMSEGRMPELRGLSVDITHLKEAEETARSATHARDVFISVASHELRTPLTSLKLQTQMLRMMVSKEVLPGLNDRVERFFSLAEGQVDRLVKLVDELLDISRIHNGKLALQTEPFDLVELVKDVHLRFSDELQKAGSPVEIDAPEPVPGCWDRFRIEQVFTNLLTNACKYGASRPISVGVRGQDDCALLTVRDQGIGIAPEDQDRIFSRFERAVSPHQISGLGLGLYIAKQVVEAHSGEITVESAREKGSLFSVRLPLVETADTSVRNAPSLF